MQTVLLQRLDFTSFFLGLSRSELVRGLDLELDLELFLELDPSLEPGGETEGLGVVWSTLDRGFPRF